MALDDRSIEDTEITVMAMQRAISDAVAIAGRTPGGAAILGEMLCAGLETVAGGAPQFTAFGDMRRDAEWWADMASPVELELYAGAALKRMERATFAPRARKRIFNVLWSSFTQAERRTFLDKAREKGA